MARRTIRCSCGASIPAAKAVRGKVRCGRCGRTRSVAAASSTFPQRRGGGSGGGPFTEKTVQVAIVGSLLTVAFLIAAGLFWNLADRFGDQLLASSTSEPADDDGVDWSSIADGDEEDSAATESDIQPISVDASEGAASTPEVVEVVTQDVGSRLRAQRRQSPVAETNLPPLRTSSRSSRYGGESLDFAAPAGDVPLSSYRSRRGRIGSCR